MLMYEKAIELRWEDKKFAAALKGIDLDEGHKSEAQEVIDRAMAKVYGVEIPDLVDMFEFSEEE